MRFLRGRNRVYSSLLALAVALQLSFGLSNPMKVMAEEVNTSTTKEVVISTKTNEAVNSTRANFVGQKNENLEKSLDTNIVSDKNIPGKVLRSDETKSQFKTPPIEGMERLTDLIKETKSPEIGQMATENYLFLESFVVDRDMYIGMGDYIDADVYIAPEATLYVVGDGEIAGDVINYGLIALSAELTADYVYGTDFRHYYGGDTYYGEILNLGGGSLWSYGFQYITELPSVPIMFYSDSQKNHDGYLPLIEGAILPIFDLQIEYEDVPLQENGVFSLPNYYVGTKTQLTFHTIDFFNQVFEYILVLEEPTPRILNYIVISNLPTKVHYIYGETLDLSGLVVTGVFTDGTTSALPLSNVNVYGFDPTSKIYGPQTLTAEYGGYTATFTVYFNRFSDVPFGYDFYTTIMDLAEKGIVVGYSDGRYGINDNITRAEVAVMLVRALGLSIDGLESPFTDVPSTHWAAGHIAAAANAKILNGYGDGRFGPANKITRAELAVMVANAYKFNINPNNIIYFNDVPSDFWAGYHIQVLASNGIISGYRDGNFGVKDYATRAHFSKFLSFSINFANKLNMAS